jgi:hypothetical protein
VYFRRCGLVLASAVLFQAARHPAPNTFRILMLRPESNYACSKAGRQGSSDAGEEAESSASYVKLNLNTEGKRKK